MNRNLWPILFGSALALTACPEDKNNDPQNPSENNKTSPTEDMNPSPDMGDAPDMDDVSDMEGEPDMGSDMMVEPGDARCELAAYSPRSLPLRPAEGETTQVTAVLECDQDIQEREVRAVLVRTRGDDVEEGIEQVVCEPGEPGFICEVTLAPLTSPGRDAVGKEELALESDFGAFEMSVGWRVGADRVVANAGKVASIALPEGFDEHGIDLRVVPVDGNLLVIGSMFNENRDHVEFFALDTSATEQGLLQAGSVSVDEADISAQDLGAVRLEDGSIDIVWWAFNKATGEIASARINIDKNASLLSEKSNPWTSLDGIAFAHILDTTMGSKGEGVDNRGVVRVLAKTTAGTIAVADLFASDGGDSVEVVSQRDAIGGVPATDVLPGMAGIEDRVRDASLDGGVFTGALDDSMLLWVATASENGTALHIEDIASTTSHTHGLLGSFAPEQVFLRITGSGDIAAVVQGDGGAKQELFVTRVDAASDHWQAPTTRPAGLDLRPPLPTTDRGIPDTSVYSASPILPVTVGSGGQVVARGHHRPDLEMRQGAVEGRWPWNWREKLGTKRSAMIETQWAADGSIASTRPIAASSELPTGELTAVTTGALDASGTRVLFAQSATCEMDATACSIELTRSRGGYGVHLRPGAGFSTMAIDKYGDILIDGVPLEFDLIGGPSIFDSFGSGGGAGSGAMIIAPISSTIEPSATHAVWSIDDAGSVSGPGLITLDPGPGVVLGKGEIREGLVTPEDVAAFAVSLAVSIGVLPAPQKEGEEPDESRCQVATVKFSYAQLEAAAQSKMGVTTVSSKHAPSLTPEGTCDGPLELDGRPPIHSRLTENGGAETFINPTFEDTADAQLNVVAAKGSSEPTTTTIATLTGAQVAQPIMFATGPDGKITVSSVSGGVEGPVKMETLATLEDEVLLGAGAFMGGGRQVLSLTSKTPRFTGRIKTVRIKKRRVGLLQGIPEGADVEIEEIAFDLGQEGAAIYEDGMQVLLGDVNGDGFEDFILSGSSSSAGDTVVFLSDGLGSVLGAPIFTTGLVHSYYGPGAMTAYPGALPAL